MHVQGPTRCRGKARFSRFLHNVATAKNLGETFELADQAQVVGAQPRGPAGDAASVPISNQLAGGRWDQGSFLEGPDGDEDETRWQGGGVGHDDLSDSSDRDSQFGGGCGPLTALANEAWDPWQGPQGRNSQQVPLLYRVEHDLSFDAVFVDSSLSCMQ
jgi:hypothetical protein